MKALLATLLIFASNISSFAGDDPRAEFLGKETNYDNAASAAKDYTFFLRIVIGGLLVETASYEVSYKGNREDLDFAKPNDISGLISRRDPKSLSSFGIEKYEIAHLIHDCINQEFFVLGGKHEYIEPPDIMKMDGHQFWVYIKYGKHETHFRRTDDSIPVRSIYVQIKKLIHESWANAAKEALSKQASPVTEIAFRATVDHVAPAMPKYASTRVVAQIDPDFDLIIRIESCIPAALEFEPGAVAVLGIHSPTLLFATDEKNTQNKTFDFLITREVVDGKANFSNLRLKPMN